MSVHDIDVDRLGTASRRAAFLSLAGFLIVAGSLGYSFFQLRSLQQRKEALSQQIASLAKQEAELRDSVQKLKYTAVTSNNQVFQLAASAKANGKTLSNGDSEYRFSILVHGSQQLLNDIQKVTYDFNHPSFTVPHQEETDPANNFQVQYVGWGCLSRVDVVVYLKDGTSQKIAFDMCKSLGADWLTP
jgi:cell division protein FtsB